MIKFSYKRLLSRRQVLNIGISAVTALATISVMKLKVLSYVIHTFNTQQKIKASQNRTFKLVGNGSLKTRAKAKGLIFGAYPQAQPQDFERDPQLKSTFVRDCGMVVAGLYWDSIRPTPTTFDFTAPDYWAKFATTNQMLLRGHPLLWHRALPPWLAETLNRQNAEKILTEHIKTVVKRYAGKMHSWDVINEPIEVGEGRSDGLKNTMWLKFLGVDYIDLAFKIARRFDSKALLVYNEQNLEYEEANQRATLKLLERLKSKGSPVQALGIQSHLSKDRDDFNPKKFRNFLRNVSSMGLKIMITELDVMDKNWPTEIDKRDRIVAATYEDYLNTVLSEKATISAITWGFTDRYTWISEFAPRSDGSEVRPLQFDRNLRPKLAWNAIARSIDRAPKR